MSIDMILLIRVLNLFISMFEWAKQCGYDTFNLGLSALSGVGEKPTDPSILTRDALHL
jgi:phosphatidylglycerol lysyltransferase